MTEECKLYSLTTLSYCNTNLLTQPRDQFASHSLASGQSRAVCFGHKVDTCSEPLPWASENYMGNAQEFRARPCYQSLHNLII